MKSSLAPHDHPTDQDPKNMLLKNRKSEEMEARKLREAGRIEKIRQERFAVQLKLWRIRAGLTQTEAGLRFSKGSGDAKPDSAKKLWGRLENGQNSKNKHDPDKLRKITKTVGGTLELAQALHDGCFRINSESLFHEYLKKKSDKGSESLYSRVDQEVLTDVAEEVAGFLRNGRDCGNSLLYLIGQREREVQRERDRRRRAKKKGVTLPKKKITFEDSRNQIVETFFSEHIFINEDTESSILSDLWLSHFQNGEKGFEILKRIEKIYGKKVDLSRDQNAYIYKHAIHLASLLLSRICAFETGNDCDGFSTKKWVRFATLEEMISAIPFSERRILNETFTKYLYSFDTFGETARVGMMVAETTTKYFERTVLDLVREISSLERMNDEITSTTHKTIKKYSLYRLYSHCTPKEFLKNLRLILDTFELYKLKFREVNPRKPLVFRIEN